MRIVTATLICWLLAGVLVKAQPGKALIRENRESIPTYDFSDPSPIPILENRKDIYPYFRFDGYAHEKEDKDWTVVRMENDLIELAVLPEVGGKVWGAKEKSTGNEFLYWNKVLKFRDIAMRGPWTSGGLEFNFGYYGHTPTTATPVDYLVKENEDGSVSCWLGAMDMHTHTQWRVEVRLPKDKAYFETKYLWYNPTPFSHSYYFWDNSAIRATQDLQFFYPGDHYIGHSGELADWPAGPDGQDLSYYKNNNFGGSKSYHILNHNRNYKAAYWHDRKFGMGHWSPHSDLPGQKLWIWALSRQGGIWEDLLTDTDGQYVEVQAGRMFNQAAIGSGLNSPFGQFSLAPQQTDTWQGAWFPVLKTGGISDASPVGVLHAEQSGSSLAVSIMALQTMDTVLEVFVGEKRIHEIPIQLAAAETWSQNLPLEKTAGHLRVEVAGLYKEWGAEPIQRPLSRMEADFSSPSGLYFQAEQDRQFRRYPEAIAGYEKCLAADPMHIDAWTKWGELLYWQGLHDAALLKLRKALEINAYDGAANYLYGVIQAEMGKLNQAEEAWALSAKSPMYRVASFVRLAEGKIRSQEFSSVTGFAQKALDSDRLQIPAFQTLAIAARYQQSPAFDSWIQRIQEIDPLSHITRAEVYLRNPSSKTESALSALIRNEFPHETFLEMAVYYDRLGLTEDAISLLKLAPDHPMVRFWMAYLTGESTTAAPLPADQVFPFRIESLKVLQAAAQQNPTWQTGYYQGLIYWSRNRQAEAIDAFNSCGNQPDFAPFYHTRALLGEEMGKDAESIIQDLKRAHELAPDGWRAAHKLSKFYLQQGMLAQGVETAANLYTKFPDHFQIGMQYAKALMYQERYAESLTILNKVKVLPFEGAQEGKVIYTQANQLEAMRLIKLAKYKQALPFLKAASEWPENLGVGAPYEPDTRLTDFLTTICLIRMGKDAEALETYANIADFTLSKRERANPLHLLGMIALDQLGRKNEADLLAERNYPGDSPQSEWLHAKWKELPEAEKVETEYRANQSVQIPHDPFSLLLHALQLNN